MKKRLKILIFDNGIGMAEAKLKEIYHILESEEEPPTEEHLGLYNIHKRLKIYYGSKYGLQIKSHAGQGTIIRILIPIKDEDIKND